MTETEVEKVTDTFQLNVPPDEEKPDRDLKAKLSLEEDETKEQPILSDLKNEVPKIEEIYLKSDCEKFNDFQTDVQDSLELDDPLQLPNDVLTETINETDSTTLLKSLNPIIIQENISNINFAEFSTNSINGIQQFTTSSSISKNACKICSICKKEFSTNQILKKHMEKTHSKIYGCKLCKRRFYDCDLYNEHLKKHNNKKPFLCRMCDENFSGRVYLNKHMQEDHNIKPTKFECDQCPKKFSAKKNLTRHMEVHRLPAAYLCKVCRKSFAKKLHYNIHTQMHEMTKHYERTLIERFH